MIKVTGCRILIRPLEAEEVDEQIKRAKQLGIVFGEKDERKAKIAMDKGILLQVGPRASDEYMGGARIGDTVGFTKFGGKFVKDIDTDSEELLVINDEDVLCVFKETK